MFSVYEWVSQTGAILLLEHCWFAPWMFQHLGDIEGLQYLCPFSDSGISVVEGAYHACDCERIFAIFLFLLLVPFLSF